MLIDNKYIIAFCSQAVNSVQSCIYAVITLQLHVCTNACMFALCYAAMTALRFAVNTYYSYVFTSELLHYVLQSIRKATILLKRKD